MPSTPQSILNDATCEICKIPPGLVFYAILAALNDLANGQTVPTDPQTLINEANCFLCLVPPGAVPYAILQAIMNLSASGGGGGGGTSGVTCGVGAPVAVPASGCALYINTTDGTLFMYYSGAWH